ncbi:MAG: gluconate 2-dehydrogenase subunit 3 family protein [Acidobacteria bacterium]|nr:gluconate 2-dehydrogenase subunit 3 family protein [Acidobacteriota bacterium]
MKRRSALGGLWGVPALAAQVPPTSNAPTRDDNPKIETATADAVASPRKRYLTAQQFATLAKLCDLIAPPFNGRPSAKEAETPEFLDFLLSESGTERQVLYAQGLDQLDINARLKQNMAFSELSETGAAEHLAPLQAKWTWRAPSDPLAMFLRDAKNDILRATANSRAWAEAAAGGRRGAGLNTFWEVID